MGSTCCADRSTETGVQEQPRLWCMVLTQWAKAPVLVLSPCWGWVMSLNHQERYIMAFFSVQIILIFLCALNSLWVIHSSKRLLGYSKHVVWHWRKTRQPNWDRSTPSVPFSHLKAWHHNNQTKPVLIHLVESRGHGHDLMKPISHSAHTLREPGGPRPVKIPQLLE